MLHRFMAFFGVWSGINFITTKMKYPFKKKSKSKDCIFFLEQSGNLDIFRVANRMTFLLLLTHSQIAKGIRKPGSQSCFLADGGSQERE